MTTRTKKSLTALGGLLLLVFVLFKVREHLPNGPNIPNMEIAILPVPKAANIKEAAIDQSNEGQTGESPNSKPPVPTDADTVKSQRLDTAIGMKNVPIHFWGRVVDQDDNPLAGARVVMSARKWQPISQFGTTHTKVERITDSEGRFEIEGVSGDVLKREVIEKEGYRLSQKAQISFSYSQSPEPFAANSREPVVFRMWKSGSAIGVISRRKLWGLVPDGRPYTFDLLADTKQEGLQSVGDFRVRLSRPAVVRSKDRFLWTLEMQGLGGGFIEATDEFQFRAPVSGYRTTVTVRMDPADTNWTSVLKRNFYLSSRAGSVYAVVRLEVIPDYNNQAAINIEAVINPSGSRNLEPK